MPRPAITAVRSARSVALGAVLAGSALLAVGLVAAPEAPPRGEHNATAFRDAGSKSIGDLQTMQATRMDMNGDGVEELVSASFGGGPMVFDPRTGVATELKLQGPVKVGGIERIRPLGIQGAEVAVLGKESDGFGEAEGVVTVGAYSTDGKAAWQIPLNERSRDAGVRHGVNASIDTADLDGDGIPEVVVVFSVSRMTESGDGAWMGRSGETQLLVLGGADGRRLAQRKIDAGGMAEVVAAPAGAGGDGVINVLSFGEAKRFTYRP